MQGVGLKKVAIRLHHRVHRSSLLSEGVMEELQVSKGH